MNGIVVGHVDLGEADRILHLLTADQGRVSLLARGARRSKKRFAGMLDLGSRVHIEARRGRGRLPTIQEVQLIEGVLRARTDIVRLSMLAFGCEVAGRLAGESVPAPRLARLLVVWLTLLEGEDEPGVASRQSFEAKALHFAGLLPDLLVCARCGRKLEGRAAFPAESGPVHASCGGGTSVHASALVRLDALMRTPLLATASETASGAGWVLVDRIQAHLRAPLKSASLLRELLSDGEHPRATGYPEGEEA